jgi:hypothetical protein
MRNLSVVSALVLTCCAVWGQAAPPREGGVYTCSDDRGHPITRDRYIGECSHKEQRLLNADGSLRRVIPPTPTPEEVAQREAEIRKDREARDKQNEAIKYDRLLQDRFPTEAWHGRARESALNATRFATQSAESRLRELAAERKQMLEEAEFYRGRRMPSALKQQLDGNEVAAAAQRNAITNAQAEQQRINDKFDAELARLRKLWNGALPGTLGPALQ